MSSKTMALATLIALVARDAAFQSTGTREGFRSYRGHRRVRNGAGTSLARITAYGWNYF